MIIILFNNNKRHTKIEQSIIPYTPFSTIGDTYIVFHSTCSVSQNILLIKRIYKIAYWKSKKIYQYTIHSHLMINILLD